VLRILVLEGSSSDAELVGARLSEGGIGCELVRVQSRDAFAAALEEGGVDLILADYDIVSSLTSEVASALEDAWLYEELGDRERALQNLVTRLLGAQEEERRRVGLRSSRRFGPDCGCRTSESAGLRPAPRPRDGARQERVGSDTRAGTDDGLGCAPGHLELEANGTRRPRTRSRHLPGGRTPE
jgi:hypothetical protein